MRISDMLAPYEYRTCVSDKNIAHDYSSIRSDMDIGYADRIYIADVYFRYAHPFRIICTSDTELDMICISDMLSSVVLFQDIIEFATTCASKNPSAIYRATCMLVTPLEVF